MNKTELRKIIREEVKREFHAILPALIRESIGSVLAKEMKRARRPRPAAKQPGGKTDVLSEGMDRTKLAELIGYGDMGTPGSAPTPNVSIAGIPMEGGLVAKERDHGVMHMRDYVNPMEGPPAQIENANVEEVEEAYEPQFMRLPGGVDGGADVPASVVAALGKKASAVLTEADQKANWRPGMKRNG